MNFEITEDEKFINHCGWDGFETSAFFKFCLVDHKNCFGCRIAYYRSPCNLSESRNNGLYVVFLEEEKI